MENIKTLFCDMPTTIAGYTVYSNADDCYTIVLNSKQSRDRNIKAYMHELSHIQNGDFEKKCSADLIEFFAHK